MNTCDMLNMLTDERAEKLKEIFTDESNQERIKNTTDIDEIIAFYEENGFIYTEEEKEVIRKTTAELTAITGSVIGLIATVSNPVGWIVGGIAAGAVAGGAVVGTIAGAVEA